MALKYLMDQTLHTNSQLLWLTKLMPFDYSIEYKKGVKNKVVGALSRVTRADILAMVVSPSDTDVFQTIIDSWNSNQELKYLIEELQAETHTHKQFTWFQGQLRRRGKLVISKVQELRKTIITLWHATPQGGHSGVEATLRRLLILFYWKNMRKEITPYEALYGRPPSLHLPYLSGESASAEVDNNLIHRELKLQLLKHHLRRAQHRMKQ
ncbi:uncharacterized protein LOC142168032 [Nicotiana tabacum]|uniref:Uncharacterized protein LOC142168032 n=1 Tax=Nicotiana tabacum TaxID=4097 RepID=A0AC58SII2_TOBAC